MKRKEGNKEEGRGKEGNEGVGGAEEWIEVNKVWKKGKGMLKEGKENDAERREGKKRC